MSADRTQTDRNHTSDLVIWPMPRYYNGIMGQSY